MTAARLILSLAASVSVIVQASASTEAEARIRDMHSSLARLGRYSVQFAVDAERGQIGGNFCVDGRDFYMSMGGTEVYAMAGVRYEVDREKREVAIDNVSGKGDILSNPTLDFTTLLDRYDASMTSVQSVDVVSLHPRSGHGTIRIYVRRGECFPHMVDYSLRNGVVRILILKVSRATSPIPRFQPERYSSFETFDYR